MNSSQNILVCVTQQKTCERLIKKASAKKEKVDGSLFVIHVAKNDWNFLDNAKEGEALEYLFGISKSVGANLTVLRSDHIVSAIADFVKENNITCIVMGESKTDHKENHFFNELKRTLSDIEIYIIPQEEM
ncbi:MAG: universal stress protein UspA [Clostridia bacterium]|nr:universal stress protein UspA [Clostridia bacterium]